MTRQGGVAYASQALDALQDRSEVGASRVAVLRRMHGVDADRHEVVELESAVVRERGAKGGKEQQREDRQNGRQRDLGGDQTRLKAEATPALRGTVATVPEGPFRRRVGGL